MWRLFISEFFYHKRILSFLVGVSFFNFLVLHNWKMISGETPPNMNTGYLSISHIFFAFVIAILMMTWFSKEKRDRQIVRLPIPISKIGTIRLLIFIVYWIILVTLFYFFTYISQYYIIEQNTILALLSQTGIAFIIFSLFFYWQDLRDLFGKKNKNSHSQQRKIIGISIIVLSLSFGFVALAGIVHNYQIYR